MKRIVLLSAVLLVLDAGAAAAQHDPRESLLQAPSATDAMICRTIPPPNPSLPRSVQSFEFSVGTATVPSAGKPPEFLTHQTYQVVWDSAGTFVLLGGAHEGAPGDTVGAGFATYAGVAAAVEGYWFALDATASQPVFVPMDSVAVRRAQELVALLWLRRCRGSPGAA